jgi:Fe-S cluster biosynthesis and repair protein YggX
VVKRYKSPITYRLREIPVKQIMVTNELKLDMSMVDHRKLLKKHEKIFVGVLSPEGEVIDYTNEDNRKPEERPGS